MVGAYVFERLFWDMRAGPDFENEAGFTIPNFGDWAAMEDLSIGPPINPVEMGHEDMLWSDNRIQNKLNGRFPLALVDPMTIPANIAWLPASGADYRKLFDKIFFNDPQFGGFQGVTRERFAMAVATYMRTLIPDKAPIDTGSMTGQEMDGFKIMSNSGCFKCHSTSGSPTMTTPGGVLSDTFDNPFSDGRFHDIGFGKRKTPTLRNVGLRKKFFSHGQGNSGNNSLAGIIKFYDNQVPGLRLIGSGPGQTLTGPEFAAVEAFLGNALTDPRVAAMAFPFDQPELASERPDYNPFEGNEYGFGSTGASGTLPEIVANGVPVVLGPSITPVITTHFKVGVGNAAPLTQALLLVGTAAANGPTLFVGGLVSLTTPVMTNAQGIGTIHMPVPLTTSSVGIPFFTQWVILESGGSSFSDAARFVPFQF
jgi:hypothetical protein